MSGLNWLRTLAKRRLLCKRWWAFKLYKILVISCLVLVFSCSRTNKQQTTDSNKTLCQSVYSSLNLQSSLPLMQNTNNTILSDEVPNTNELCPWEYRLQLKQGVMTLGFRKLVPSYALAPSIHIPVANCITKLERCNLIPNKHPTLRAFPITFWNADITAQHWIRLSIRRDAASDSDRDGRHERWELQSVL
jgi:hypothetical protein